MGAELGTQTDNPAGQVPVGPETQVVADDGQVPESVDELKHLVGKLRKEAAQHRITARAAEQKLESYNETRRAAEVEEAKKRDQFQVQYETSTQEVKRLSTELGRARLDSLIERELIKLKPKLETIDDIMKVMDRSGLELKDGGVEGLSVKVAEFRKAKPWYFEPDASASGLHGYNPGNGAGVGVVVTTTQRREAERRGMKPEEYAALEANVAAMRKQRGT